MGSLAISVFKINGYNLVCRHTGLDLAFQMLWEEAEGYWLGLEYLLEEL